MTNLSGWEKDTSPYHRGEQELHERLGKKDRQEQIAKRIHRPFMPQQHRDFFHELPFMIIGSVTPDEWPTASIIFGKPGFVETPTERKLRVNANPVQGDPLSRNLRENTPVSFLGIELPTRRRNRMNGVIANHSDHHFEADVVQSYGNCPQYIQARSMEFIREPNSKQSVDVDSFITIDNQYREFIQKADTFFVASYNHEDDIYDTGGVDINHRGGKPGFVQIEGNILTIPDYKGNNSFNTLGNFLINPKAGLLFIDFQNGDLLMLSGTVNLEWEKNALVESLPGAQRAWQFTLHHGVHLKNASPLRWRLEEMSPHLNF